MMHGPTPGVSLLVNADADSMEGIVDYGVGVVTKASPRRAAIEEAQAELRQEYDVREQRRRELEFLEKGGNPLDFKSAYSASISIRSTSLADQLAEQYVTSETKGSFAMAASPQGDSIESSGRPGSVVCRNTDTDSMYDGDNSNLDSDINAKRKGKRGSAILLGQPSKIGSSSNAKEPDAAASFRVGAKGQAYARRNRSRTNRNSPNLVSTNQGLHHGNTNSVTITSYPRGTKVPLPEVHGEGCTVSTINNPKTDILDGNIEANSETSHGHPDTVLDNTMIMDNMKLEADEMKITENKQNHDQNNHFEVADRAPNSVASQSSGIIGKDEALSVGVLESSGNNKGIVNDENINVSSVPESTMLHENLGQTTEIMTDNDKNQDFSINGTMNIEENSNRDQSLILRSKEILDRNLKDESSYPRSSIFQDGNDLKDSQLIALNVPANIDNESGSAHVETETELLSYKNDKQSATVPVPNIDCVKSNGEYTCEPRTEVDNSLSDPIAKDAGATASMLVSPIYETLKVTPPQENSESSKLQNSQQLELAKKMHEDAILKEALKIQANRKWAGELSGCYKTSEKRRKCHWDFVLEEMSWAANDFMQERLWKITAAAQVAKQIAYNSQATIEKFSMPRKQKKIARTLARAIMQFWHSAEVSRRSDGSPNGAHLECNSNMLNTWKTNGMDGEKDQGKSSTVSELSRPILRCAIQDYAIRFLKHQSRSADYSLLAVAPATPDRENDVGILELSSEDQLPEESLFYVVPHGAMQVYRDSIESQCVHYKKAGNTIRQEDCELSLCGSVADGPRENAYEEDQGDTCTYILPGASSSGLSSKFTLKKKKLSHQKSYASKMYEVGNGMTYEPGLENKCGTEYFPLNGKRPSSAINVGSIPTKRLRTAARRVIPPYTSGLTSSMQVNSKTDVSSGETSSLQDDQSSLNGGSLTRRNVEVESAMDFDRQMQFDGSEVMKSKKKKKPKHLGYRNNLDDSSFLVAGKNSSYEHRLQVDRLVQDEHKDHAKRRLETQHFDSNGVAVSYGQHAAKKPKLLKQLPDTLPEVLTPATGSMPSPVASQMSNMSNSNKLMKIIANRDRGRKSKGLKMPAGYSGTGSQWSNFEDQALVVLVHDMGPNWELVSDAINSTLQFKCIFRKPKECKERHKFLMDKSAGDGADSAEDSGSSQPYPSTLPGIPKGSARQLFQRLQGPMEEDTLRTHFDKIISLNQQLHSCRRQEVKQVIPPHSSHVVALSQVCPNGGILTPLDLCESTASSPDLFSLGYQGSQSGGLAVSNHSGSMTPILPSGANTILQGSGVALNSSLPTAPNPMSISPRDAQRYALPRPTALPVDDPQRMQQYSPMLPARNIQQSSMPLPGSFSVGVDRGVRMLAGGNGMGMMCAMPRSMPMPRTGFQGLGSAGMLNMVSASNMIPNGAHGMQNQVNVHPAAVSATGNSTLRPRDSLQILRPGQNTDAMMQELQLQVSQGNGQTVTPFNGMATSFSNATVASTLQTFPVQQNQGQMLGNSHQPHLQGANQTSSQQSYAIQQRKIQQRMMPQPHHSFSGAGAVSPVQNNPQVHSQNQSSSPVTAVPSSQVQNKQQNMSRNSQVSIQNQIMKQRQRQQPQQQQQQQPRQHQQQRQQSQQQAKLMKGGLGRGNTMLPPNLPGDASQINGPSTAPKSQVPEKHLMQQSQGFFPGSSSLNSSQTKMYPGSLPQSAKQMTPVSDASNQSPAQDPSNSHMVASQHTPVPSSVSLPGAHQQPQPRYMSQNQQTIQKMVQQNRQPEPNTRIQTTVDQMQVNPMTTSASVSQGTVLSTSAPMVSPATTWKPEPSYDKNTCSKIIQAPNSLAEIVGTDTLPSSSGQGMVPPQQFSGTVSLHGHGIGGQWQQTPQPQPQRQIRQTGQGELGTQNSNSAPG